VEGRVALGTEQGRAHFPVFAAFAGGRMCGFILWIDDAWHRWAKEAGEKRSGYDGQGAWSDRQHAAFDAWLDAGGMNP